MAVSETGSMEKQDSNNGLQFSPLTMNWIANNAADYLGNLDLNTRYTVDPLSNSIHLEPVPVPHWMHCQPTPQSYVEFHAERGYPEIQEQMTYGTSTKVPTFGLAYPTHMEEYHNEGDFITTVIGLEHQFGLQKQIWNEECRHAIETYPGSSSAASEYPSEARRKRSREKAYASDRCRRLRISHWLDALQELVPHSKVGDKATLLDNVIDYIKYLQNQMKDLCHSRLGGEPTSDSIIFLEGHGHYSVQEQMLKGPLEETMGKLIDVYPSAANEMLQSRGLIVMPMTFAEGLLEGAFDTQVITPCWRNLISVSPVMHLGLNCGFKTSCSATREYKQSLWPFEYQWPKNKCLN